MKKQLKKWTKRLMATGVLITVLLIIIILNPVLMYAHKTVHNSYGIYHNKPLQDSVFLRIDDATALIQFSEFYRKDLKLDICLNDGSAYPGIIRRLRGPAFAWGFYNKVVLQGQASFADNYVELRGYKWNLTQLLAHEMVHCLQFNKLGFWHSKPVASIPNWKWEGYAEYVSRRGGTQTDLQKNIQRLQQADTMDANSWAIELEDGTIAPREYYQYWLLVQYCLDVKRMSYQELLDDKRDENVINEEMRKWATDI